MKHNINRLLSLVLALVMLVGVLPLSAMQVDAAATLIEDVSAIADPTVLFEEDFEDAEIGSNIAGSTITYEYGSYRWYFNNAGANDSATVQAFDAAYGNSAKLHVETKTSGTRETYIEITNSSSYPFSSSKVYRIEFDVYGKFTAPYAGFRTRTDGGTEDGVVEQTNTSVANVWTHVVYDLQPSADHTKLRLTFRLAASKAGDFYFDNVKITEYTPVTDAASFTSVCQTEGSTITLQKDMDLTGTDVALGAGVQLDLNGYSLAASSLDAVTSDGAVLVDNSTEKTGRIDTDSLALANNNPQLPVKLSDGYGLASLNMDSRYIKQTGNNDGFVVTARPGFGNSTFRNAVATGSSGISMAFRISWKDVYGNEGSKDVSLNDYIANVYSGVSAGKAFKGTFTNPGDAQWFRVDVVASACGVVITSADAVSDDVVKYQNPNEANKTYLFAHDFNVASAESYAKGSSIASKRGEGSLSVGVDTAEMNGVLVANGGSGSQFSFNVPTSGTYVVEFQVMVDLDSGNEKTNLVVQLAADRNTTYRYQPILVATSANDFRTPIYSGDEEKKVGEDLPNDGNHSYGDPEGNWSSVKMVLDCDNHQITITFNGETYTQYLHSYTGKLYIARSEGYRVVSLDDLKIYTIN